MSLLLKQPNMMLVVFIMVVINVIMIVLIDARPAITITSTTNTIYMKFEYKLASLINTTIDTQSSSKLTTTSEEEAETAATLDFQTEYLHRKENENENELEHDEQEQFQLSTSINQMAINEELASNTWDYMTELVFILVLAVLTLPANFFLFIFYNRKVRRYKRLKHLNLRYACIANSFHTYLIEICSFDTVIVIYLILNTTFHLLFYLKKSQYESVFDISNFTCKFFIYILRISGAMSNYLVFLLSLNRCFLIMFRHKPTVEFNYNSHRLCLNTKYLTLFLFCICTIANVFRLELLNLNSSMQPPPPPSIASGPDSNLTTPVATTTASKGHLGNLMELVASYAAHDPEWLEQANSLNLTSIESTLSGIVAGKRPECGPNIGSITFAISDSTNTLFWSIVIYNLIFAILPAVGNLVLSGYLIVKRSQLKSRLVQLTECIEKFKSTPDYARIKMVHHLNDDCGGENGEKKLDAAETGALIDDAASGTNSHLINEIKTLQLNEFQAEFLKTCTPCIAFSLTHVILFLPYSIIEVINQIRPNFTLIHILQYTTYIRYLFYCCKFYLLFLVSYRFRRETRRFFSKQSTSSSLLLIDQLPKHISTMAARARPANGTLHASNHEIEMKIMNGGESNKEIASSKL